MVRQNAPAKSKADKKAEPKQDKKNDETPDAPEAPESSDNGESNDKPDNKALLEAYKETANKVVAQHEDGKLTDEQIAPVVEAYRALSGVKFYNAAKTWTIDQMTASVMPPVEDYPLAKAWVLIKDSLKSVTPTREKKPVDPTEAYVLRRYTLDLAFTLIDEMRPDGLAEDWEQRIETFADEHRGEVEAYQAWLADESEDKGDKPEMHSAVKDAFKYATTKARKGGGGGGQRRSSDLPKRSTKTHIEQVFADKPVGTKLTIAQIAGTKSAEYGDDNPSAGAINQRVFPKGDKAADLPEGIEAVDEQPRAAVKVS